MSVTVTCCTANMSDRRADMSTFRAIVLIAVDNSEHSEYAFNWYRDYIHKPEFYTVLLHCTEHNDQEMLQASPGTTAKMVRELTEEMGTIESKFGQLMALNGIKGRIRRGSGKPGEAIVNAAHEEGATMIVTGTRSLGKLKRAILGSVSDYVVHHSKIPVITCKNRD